MAGLPLYSGTDRLTRLETCMNLNRRRGAIALFTALGVFLIGLAIALNIGWILLNTRRLAIDILGVVLFSVLVAGVVLNTVFLLREIRRNERQDSFLNAVTHELKTPVASIRLYLETLQRRALDEEQRQNFYGIMLADTDRLLSTVDQVLKAGELGQRARQRNRALVDMERLVRECIAILSQRHHLQGEPVRLLPVPGAVSLPVRGIEADLRTAILNILDNAVKYSPDALDVTCTLAIADYNKVVLTVRDTGLGIPPGQLKRVFKRFYRVPGRSMVRVKGTGLGLFLVRAIARQHGGEATAASAGPGQGTSIQLQLPLATA